MASLKPFVSLLILFSFASDAASRPIIQMLPTQYLGRFDSVDQCESWKFSFEASNDRFLVPEECVGFVKTYLETDERYNTDTFFSSLCAVNFSQSVEINPDGKDAWIFDVDETLLSNLPYYQQRGYGSEAFNETDFYVWAKEANAPLNGGGWWAYDLLQAYGYKIIILSGRDEFTRSFTEQNLLNAGYSNWEKLILRGPDDQGKAAIVYKSEKRAELVQQGYRLHGIIGDQWSDLLGSSLATRSFKLPNPLYYVP